MYTTTDDKGILNNYATEPKMYFANSPSPTQQRNYLLQGAVATLFITALVLVAVVVS